MASIFATTLLTSGSATLLATAIGVPLGARCARAGGLEWLRVLVRTLYGLPPVVVGVLVYLLLSNDGPLGPLDLLFTVEAMVLAQTLLVLPLVWGGTWAAFDAITPGHRHAIALLGLERWNGLKVEVGLVWRGVLNGVALGFGRAIAEVGSVLMVGGNIAGRTRVLTTSIVLETSKGDLGAAVVQGGLLLLLALAMMFLIEGLRGIAPRATAPAKAASSPGGLASSFPQHTWDRISVVRGGVTVLDLRNLEVRGGEILVVLGASGAGKSTLLRCVAGLEPDIEGAPVAQGRGGVGLVAQHPVLLSNTPLDEVLLAGGAADLLGLVSMAGLEGRPATALSGGERQRTSLARALSLRPSMLLLDEFSSGLDLATTLRIEGLVRQVASEGAAVVIATHDLAQAQRLADRRVLLVGGQAVDESSEEGRALLGLALQG
jgi:tungstate transport system ATP-binding protein